MVALLTTLASIAALLVETWLAARPKREKEKQDEAKQIGRTALIDGDIAAVELRIDRVLDAAETGAGGDAGGAGHPDQAGGSVSAERLGAFGISVGPDTGAGGKMSG